MADSGISRLGVGREAVLTLGDHRYGSWYRQTYHALRAFLGVSLALVLVFLLLGLVLYVLERSLSEPLRPVQEALSRHIFASPDVTSGFLDTVAGGFLTMTSIIVTMLLLVLQQTASNMGNLVYDQFLARRRNKLYTGLIVGTLVLSLFVRSTVSDSFNPVLGASAVLVVSVASIVLLLAFLFTTIEQMRPETIITDIHQATLEARQRQLAFVQRTRRRPHTSTGPIVQIRTEADGYLVGLNLRQLARSLAGVGADVEVLLVAAPGTFAAYYDLLAEVRAADLKTAREVAESVGRSFRFARKREMRQDPAYGLEQLEMVAWTEVSSAKQNPEVGVRAIHALRDLLSRWLMQDIEVEAQEPLPVVYSDQLLHAGLDVLESMGIICFESHEHQVLAEVLRTVDVLFDRLSLDLRDRAQEIVLRFLPNLNEEMLSHELDVALFHVAATMERLGEAEAADAVREARQQQFGAPDFPSTVIRPNESILGSPREPGFRGERS